MMYKFIGCICKIIKKFNDDNVPTIAGELTYKILLSIFPFIIFLMSMLGFFNLDHNILYNLLTAGYIPNEIMSLFNLFIEEVVETKRLTLLSSSFFISIYSSSTGFSALVRGINKIYGMEERRGFLKLRLISFYLLNLFVFSIMFCMVLIVFGDKFIDFLQSCFVFSTTVRFLVNVMEYVVVLSVLIFIVSMIYKISFCGRIRVLDVLPGSVLVVLSWVLLSMGFDFYLNNFSRYSKIYGSIGGIFILMFWLNMLIYVMLIGAEINHFISAHKK